MTSLSIAHPHPCTCSISSALNRIFKQFNWRYSHNMPLGKIAPLLWVLFIREQQTEENNFFFPWIYFMPHSCSYRRDCSKSLDPMPTRFSLNCRLTARHPSLCSQLQAIWENHAELTTNSSALSAKRTKTSRTRGLFSSSQFHSCKRNSKRWPREMEDDFVQLQPAFIRNFNCFDFWFTQELCSIGDSEDYVCTK